MRTLRLIIVLPCLLLLTVACGGIPSNSPSNSVLPTQDVNQVVQATFQAMTAGPSAQPPATLAPATASGAAGSIAGNLTYPADSLPPMYVTAYQVGTQNYQYVITQPGQSTYEIDDLPPGTYHIVAYTVGGGGFPAGFAGGFTQALACGLTSNCTDHSLTDVPLAAGQAVTGIDPADWYAPDGSFPPFPQQPVAPASPSTPTP